MGSRFSAVLVLLLTSYGYSQVYVYECDVLPVDAGWTLVQNVCGLEEWVDGSTLVEHAEFCPPPNEDEGQQIDYLIHIPSFLGVQEMFFEWRVESTGDRSELVFTAPCAFVIANDSSAGHHFSIARDQIRYIRDNLTVPSEWIDIAADVPHTYRVEHIGDQSFALYIDGVVADFGVPLGEMMALSPRVRFRAKSQFGPSTTTWEYMRWGVLPADGSGDFDSSGAADAFDLFYFSECIDRGLAGEAADPSCQWADFNADNTVNCADAAAFAAIYTGDPTDLNFTQCNPIPAVSQWGVVILTLLAASSGAIVFGRPCDRSNAAA